MPSLQNAGDAGAAAFAEGRTLALEDAVAYALAEARTRLPSRPQAKAPSRRWT
jgi:hypothetical protein